MSLFLCHPFSKLQSGNSRSSCPNNNSVVKCVSGTTRYLQQPMVASLVDIPRNNFILLCPQIFLNLFGLCPLLISTNLFSQLKSIHDSAGTPGRMFHWERYIFSGSSRSTLACNEAVIDLLFIWQIKLFFFQLGCQLLSLLLAIRPICLI